MAESDPFRPDAVLVYRFIRDHGPVSTQDIVEACFPVASEGPASSVAAIAKRSWRRAIDSIVWLRHAGVPIFAQSNPSEPTWFELRAATDSSSPKERRSPTPEVLGPRAEPSDAKAPSDAMGLWHGEG